MSTIRFISSIKPEKNLSQSLNYRYYPDKEMREKILEEVKSHIKEDYDINEDRVEVNIEVTIKKYDTSKFYYDKLLKPTDEPKNT